MISIALINTMTKINFGKKRFTWLICPHHCYPEGKSGKELKKTPWGNSAYRFAIHGLLSLLSYQDWMTTGGMPTMDWSLLYQSSVKNILTDMSTDPLNGKVFSTESPSFQMSLACVKLIKLSRHLEIKKEKQNFHS